MTDTSAPDSGASDGTPSADDAHVQRASIQPAGSVSDASDSAAEGTGAVVTQGPPRRSLPMIPGPIDVAVAGWKRLRRMSTALMLLFVLATATLIATFVPQEPVIASTVNLWRDGVEGPGAGVSRALDFLSLFDVFGSWWFGLLTALLMVSLTACLIPRFKVFSRNVRQPAKVGTNLRRLSHSVDLPRPTGRSESEILDAIAPTFRRYRTLRATTRDGAAQLAVERGHWREAGSLIFHASFYLLLIGVTLGSAFSFTGQIDIAEGDLFADTPLGYQSQTSGRFWDVTDHQGAITAIEDFEVTYLDGENRFVPDEFVSTVTFQGRDGVQSTEEIRVNHPVHFDGLTYYQRAFGFAPQVTVRSGLNGNDLYQDNVILREDDFGLWRGRAKITQGSSDPDRPLPQIGMELVFIPDAEFTDEGLQLNSPEPNDPRMAITIYSADDLGLDRTVPVSQLNWPESAVLGSAMITPGQSAGIGTEQFPSLFEVDFAPGELTMWTGLQVSHQPFRWLILTAASLLLTGLIPSMYAYRRRVWIQVEDDHLVMAGVALHRKERFAEEFDELVEQVRDALPSGTATGEDHPAPALLASDRSHS